MMVASSIAIPR